LSSRLRHIYSVTHFSDSQRIRRQVIEFYLRKSFYSLDHDQRRAIITYLDDRGNQILQNAALLIIERNKLRRSADLYKYGGNGK
jgi:hypothetical protein